MANGRYNPKRDNQLDPGIKPFVEALRSEGVETFESCQGGKGHCFPEPTIRFHGEYYEGYRVAAIALKKGLPVAELRRSWGLHDNEIVGPWWELTFRTTAT